MYQLHPCKAFATPPRAQYPPVSGRTIVTVTVIFVDRMNAEGTRRVGNCVTLYYRNPMPQDDFDLVHEAILTELEINAPREFEDPARLSQERCKLWLRLVSISKGRYENRI